MARNLIFETHDLPKNIFYRWLHAWVASLPNLKYIVVISQALKKDYLSLYPTLRPDLIVVAHDGADQVKKPKARVNAQRLSLGYVGHLYPGRGENLMLEIARRMPDLDLHIVGGTEAKVSELQQNGIPSNVTLHGHVPPSTLENYYSKFDILLAPYQRRVSVAGGRGNTVRYMSPLKIFEYMSWGRAIVASDLSAINEILENQKSALLANPDSIDDWVSKIRLLVENEHLRWELGSEALLTFSKQYTWKIRAEKLMKLYESMN